MSLTFPQLFPKYWRSARPLCELPTRLSTAISLGLVLSSRLVAQTPFRAEVIAHSAPIICEEESNVYLRSSLRVQWTNTSKKPEKFYDELNDHVLFKTAIDTSKKNVAERMIGDAYVTEPHYVRLRSVKSVIVTMEIGILIDTPDHAPMLRLMPGTYYLRLLTGTDGQETEESLGYSYSAPLAIDVPPIPSSVPACPAYSWKKRKN